jgi:hypothetical protein
MADDNAVPDDENDAPAPLAPAAKADDVPSEVKAALRKANKEAETLRLRLKEFEDRDKTEAQKLEERASAAESRLGPVEQENARLRVALAKGLPADLVDRLRGGSEQELAADADKLLELVGQQASGGSFDGGARRTAPPAGDMNSLIRQQAAARRGA